MSIPINSNLVPRTTGYPLVDDSSVAGSMHIVSTIADRDAIPSYVRKAGMISWVQFDTTLYQLQDDLSTWLSIDLGAGNEFQGPTKFANYSAQLNELVKVDSTGGSFNITLPLAFGHNSKITVKSKSDSDNPVTVLSSGSDTIDGIPSVVIDLGRISFTFISDGVSEWMII